MTEEGITVVDNGEFTLDDVQCWRQCDEEKGRAVWFDSGFFKAMTYKTITGARSYFNKRNLLHVYERYCGANPFVLNRGRANPSECDQNRSRDVNFNVGDVAKACVIKTRDYIKYEKDKRSPRLKPLEFVHLVRFIAYVKVKSIGYLIYAIKRRMLKEGIGGQSRDSSVNQAQRNESEEVFERTEETQDVSVDDGGSKKDGECETFKEDGVTNAIKDNLNAAGFNAIPSQAIHITEARRDTLTDDRDAAFDYENADLIGQLILKANELLDSFSGSRMATTARRNHLGILRNLPRIECHFDRKFNMAPVRTIDFILSRSAHMDYVRDVKQILGNKFKRGTYKSANDRLTVAWLRFVNGPAKNEWAHYCSLRVEVFQVL
ncbi:MAG: hypothetical protein JW884_01280 [Deltaproteobacteria bacterium]|nr:hypothetical protein [Deltaproteobacteria bacterium]